MKFGLHFQLPRSPHETDLKLFRNSLEQAAHAESLGFESVWPVEQHFNASFSLLSSPLLWLAVLAERTKTLRLGIGIILLPLAHPIRIAEEIATLDVLSNGRVEFGIGRGVFPSHFSGFGVPQDESRERFLEGMDVIRKAWTQNRFSHAGKFFCFEDLSVVPKPIQQPYPPISVAANTPETFELMGDLGLPILSASQVNTFPKLRELIPLYRRAYTRAGHENAGEALSLLAPVFVGESNNSVRHTTEPSINRFIQSLIDTFPRAPSNDSPKGKLLADAAERLRNTTYDDVCNTMAIYETPELCVEKLGRLQEEFNMNRFICWFNTGGLIPHAQVMKSMELFAERVIPHFS